MSNTIRKSVYFIGTDHDSAGMPKPFHSYLLISSAWEMPDTAVASIWQASAGAPVPDLSSKIVQVGGPQAAIKELIRSLEEMDSNRELRKIEREL